VPGKVAGRLVWVCRVRRVLAMDSLMVGLHEDGKWECLSHTPTLFIQDACLLIS